MTTITGDNTLHASQKSSNGRVQQVMVADSFFTENNFTNKTLSFALACLFTCCGCGLLQHISREYLPPAGGLPPLMMGESAWLSVICRDISLEYWDGSTFLVSRDRLKKAVVKAVWRAQGRSKYIRLVKRIWLANG
ncbi:hypothetical protein AVEN_130204-1 [Araneus ventricosus]|uniref:Uncharacterized protein n=1 Tax=Araneus ventricosus TaxID=182803 RepID=A0A4Y2L5M3_ARAVE|nr:hypothetical protein AVEN_130204-1 [Araneus ventricosus]